MYYRRKVRFLMFCKIYKGGSWYIYIIYIVIRALRVITVFNEIYHVELIMCLLSGSGIRVEISKLTNSISLYV